jgi:hypothetical protein
MVAGFPFARNMHQKAKEWPSIFQRLRDAADSIGLVPFLTEFGCSQDWKGHTRLHPRIYRHSVVRACMDLRFQQVEAQLLNATYWNYDLYNQKREKDNWNGKNFSLLGPERSSRNLDIVARPYPMRSSAMPQRVFFDLESKNAVLMLAGAVGDNEPTVIFVPRTVHYPGDDFEVCATTPASSVIWDETNQMLYWYPDKTLPTNQLIISRSGGFNKRVLPAESQELLSSGKSFFMIVGKDKKIPIAYAVTQYAPAQSSGSDSTRAPQKLRAGDATSTAEIQK